MIQEDEKIILSSIARRLQVNPIMFDVGACKGEYTKYFLSQFPDVCCYLFEPNLLLYQKLILQFDSYQLAMSNQEGLAPFYICHQESYELSSLYKREVYSNGVLVSTPLIRTTTIDAFCEKKEISFIDFMKVDVEGAEFDVLRGAYKMMTRKRIDFIQLEYGNTYLDSGIRFAEIMSYAQSKGYYAYEVMYGRLRLMTANDFKEDYRFTNFLLTPLNIDHD